MGSPLLRRWVRAEDICEGWAIIDIEGDESGPINEGTLCPKGSNTFQLTINPHRQKYALYRAPTATTGSNDRWIGLWTASRNSRKKHASLDFVEKDEDGDVINHTLSMAHWAGPRSTTKRTPL